MIKNTLGKIKKKIKKKKINVWKTIFWLNILGNVPLSSKNLKSNWFTCISFFVMLVNHFSAPYQGSMVFPKIFIGTYEFNIHNIQLSMFYINTVIFFSSLIRNRIIFWKKPVYIEKVMQKRFKGGNCFSLILKKKPNFLFALNGLGIISFLFID